MNKWQDPNLSLGERCIEFSKNELQNNISEDKVGSYTSPRIREYFSICTRLVNGKEIPVTLTSGNWCAASASFALKESLLSNEIVPHGFRLGVVEIVYDMVGRNLYQPITKVRQGLYQIRIGDLIIFDRSNPNDPSTSWYRHIGRVYNCDDNGGFDCISGNSGGHWRITQHKLSQNNLLGFGSYSKINNTNNVLSGEVDLSKDSGIDLSNFYKYYNKIFVKKDE